MERFGVAARYPDLLAMAQKDAEGQLGVNAAKVLLDKGQKPLFEQGLKDKNPDLAVATAKILGTGGDGASGRPPHGPGQG